MKSRSPILFIVSALTLALAIIFGSQGMDKKDHYYLSESSYGRSTNAYVGGDAYNYIINGTYFSGYSALCGGLLAASGATFAAGMVVQTIEDTAKTGIGIDSHTSTSAKAPAAKSGQASKPVKPRKPPVVTLGSKARTASPAVDNNATADSTEDELLNL